ncbi:MAG: YceH family protein [Fimbriiglobus sp.]
MEAETWQPLPDYERRVLGVLIEKSKTSKSPDAYPMTLNSITTGCNQKSNREPIYELDEDIVESTLTDLQRKGIVVKMVGSRADRWRHQLYELWKVDKVEMAILAELLLRGPQTEGDLRGRASRMEEIADLETLRQHLKKLETRNLVVYLTSPDRRGAMLTHGFHTPEELSDARQADSQRAPELTTSRTAQEDRIVALEERVARLEAAVANVLAAR